MTVAPQADTEVVTGTIIGIVQKGPDKWQVQVDVGRQNPRGLWTKDQSLVAQLSMMIGQTMSFLCGQSHWNRGDGTPVVSLWINGVGPPQEMPQQAPPPVPMQTVQQQAPPPMQQWTPPQQPTVVQPQATPMGGMPQVTSTQSFGESRYLQERAVERPYIHRQTASKVAAILISHVPAEQRTLDNVLRLAERLVAYYEQGMQMTNPGSDGGTDPGAQGIPHTDDDIPF